MQESFYVFVYIVGITLVSALLAALAQYLFKSSIKKFGLNIKEVLDALLNKKVIAGIIVYMISLVIYLAALHYGELSFVYPFIASTFIFVMLISKYKIGEKVGRMRVLGIILIVLGIALTALTY